MPFPLNTTIDRFGTQTTLTSATSAVASGGYSVAGDTLNNLNTTDTLYLTIVLEANFAVAPTFGETISLFVRPAGLPPTNQNSPNPAANWENYKVGDIPVNNSTGTQVSTITIKLRLHETSTGTRFYIQNNTSQSLPAGWSLKGTPTTSGPNPGIGIVTDSQIVLFEPFVEITNLGGTGAVVDAAFSATGDNQIISNPDDNSIFSITYRCNYSVAPDLLSEVWIYGRQLNIVGGQNEPFPSASYRNQLIGVLPVVNITSVQLITIYVSWDLVESGVDKQYVIENRTGQSIPATWSLFETPLTIGQQ